MEGDVTANPDHRGGGGGLMRHVASHVRAGDVHDGPDDAASECDAGGGWGQPGVEYNILAWVSAQWDEISS